MIILSIAAVMQSDGLKYLRQNYPLLQFELVRTVVGCKEEFRGKRKYETVRSQSSNGDDTNYRSVRQQTQENGDQGSQSLKVTYSDGVKQQ